MNKIIKIINCVEILSDLYTSGLDSSTHAYSSRINIRDGYIEIKNWCDASLIYSTNKSDLNTSILNENRFSYIPSTKLIMVNQQYFSTEEFSLFQASVTCDHRSSDYFELFKECVEIDFDLRFSIKNIHGRKGFSDSNPVDDFYNTLMHMRRLQ